MDAEQQRIADLAAGWEGSEADVTVSGRDAAVLEGAGAKLSPVKGREGVFTVKGKELAACAERLRQQKRAVKSGEPVPLSETTQTPNQISIGGPADLRAQASEGAAGDNTPTAPGADAVDADDDLDGLTVAELRDLAADEEIDLRGAGRKEEIVAAIRKGRNAQ